MHSRLETVRRIAAGELTVEAGAALHGVAPETIVEWSELFLAGAQTRRRASRSLVVAFAVFGALGLAGVARAACTTMYGNLIGVCANEPALASTYNTNLQRIDTRLEAGMTSVGQLRGDLNTTSAQTANKVGALGTTGATLQAPIRFGGGNCTANEVPFVNASGVVDCRPLYSNSGSPLITAWETGDLVSNHQGGVAQSLGPTSDRVCFLSDVRFSDIDDGSEEARCLVERNEPNWTLIAASNGDSRAVCRARCIQFNF